MYVVISPSSFQKLEEILKSLGRENKLIITTLGVSFALRNHVNIDIALDNGAIVRSFSHKPPKIEGIPDYESEAIMVAVELNALLVTDNDDVKKKALDLGVRVMSSQELLSSS
ncbi:PIN domain-containing protein [Sulfolobus acidocaldarius]|uniref:Uncharacterized protein n=4 Tax=Sulfolobus acidocaldarius TaxID=2285 RepID=Q4JBS2_SULAC|nr:PIN domain-containing protein [Sulfolobus acidocaldarius]AAY79757.1 hypothetical protein Saci_0341 [Sulfolobus acidocaldarius DSM 639]